MYRFIVLLALLAIAFGQGEIGLKTVVEDTKLLLIQMQCAISPILSL